MKSAAKHAVLNGTSARIIAVLLLAALTLSEAAKPWRSVVSRDAAASRHMPPAAQGTLPGTSPASYTSIMAEPLFSSSRRPWAPPPPPRGAAPPQLPTPLPMWPGYALEGIVVSAQGRAALVRLSDGRQTVRLHEGDQLDGWMLKAIGNESIRFVAFGAVHDLSFLPPRPPPPGLTFASTHGFPVR